MRRWIFLVLVVLIGCGADTAPSVPDAVAHPCYAPPPSEDLLRWKLAVNKLRRRIAPDGLVESDGTDTRRDVAVWLQCRALLQK